ncbi:MAG: glycerol-3-phosphate 1-O-acyltransferase PlsY [Thermodesulfobacteriota bacterium]
MVFFFFLLAYFLGSIPTGVIVAKAFGSIDPRTQGSKNIGATNVFRTGGKKLGIITLAGDILKGLIPVVLAKGYIDSFFWIGAIALAAFLGHLYPIFLRFKGGKGIATGLGIFLALAPFPAFLSLSVFALVLYKWRYVSLGSLTATVAFPFFLFLFNAHPDFILFAIIIGVLIFYRHKDNISRLRAGTESKFGQAKIKIAI